MEKFDKIIIAVIVIGLILGWLFEPAITVIAGVSLWFCILLLLGGAEDGNPHRTAILLYRGIPDRPLVRRAMKPQSIDKERGIRRKCFWLLLISGGFLVGTGIYWMYGLGMW